MLISRREKSDTDHGFWLMRGAQPATRAGARPFAGSPIPALLTTPPRAVKKSILSLLFNLMSAFRTAPYLREPLALLGRICIGNFIAFAMNSCPRNISNGLWMDSEPCLQLKSSDGSSSVLGGSLDSRGFGQAEERCDC